MTSKNGNLKAHSTMNGNSILQYIFKKIDLRIKRSGNALSCPYPVFMALT